MRQSGPTRRRAIVVAAILTVAEAIAVVGRGGTIGLNTVVRCRRGHLFRTIWIPGVSFKALRLGWCRLQRCPVGAHWSLVVPVRVSTLSGADRQVASERHDVRVP